MDKNSPIGVFDSGIGGISVLIELKKLLPNEDFIYYGDIKNSPYGEKSKLKVEKLSVSIADYLIKQDSKAIVVACNTATSAAISTLRNKYKDRIIIGLEPALKPAVLSKEHPNVLVIATSLTLLEEKYVNLKKIFDNQAKIIECPAPKLVEFIEKNDISSKQFHDYLYDLFSPYFSKRIDCIVLGCTHFPFIKEQIKNIFPYEVSLFDGAYGASKEALRQLKKYDLLNDSSKPGNISFVNSLNDENISQIWKDLLNQHSK